MLIKDDVCVCDQCSKRWLPETDKMPLRCSRCKSTKWNSGAPAPEPTAAPQMPDAPEPVPPAAPHKDGRPKSLRYPQRPPRRSKASRRKPRTKVQAISRPATQASQMTTRTQEMASAHAVNCSCYSCHTPDW
jgi:hypothetical protein